jgi:hypothetical protein
MNWKIFFAKFITFIVALQILNVSIYAQDIDMLQQRNVLSYSNEINSITEYVSEVILKHSNAFPEYPNDGHKEMQFSKHIDLNLFSFHHFKAQPTPKAYIEYLYPHKIDYNFLFFKEINPPPPKA